MSKPTTPERSPRKFRFLVGMVCEAGQHENCVGVGDPYDDEAGRDPWVCGCDCHEWLMEAGDAD